MNRREFQKYVLSAGVLGVLDMPLGVYGANAQGRGGVLNTIVQPEPATLIVGLNVQTPTQVVGGKIFQSLLTYGFDLSPQPSLADSFTISPDGRVYTFVLAKNVTWHDGHPFSAEDVVFSIGKMWMETHPRARATFQRCESITAPDANTVVFTLREPYGPFILAFEFSTTPIMPKHLYDRTDYQNNPANDKPIGTGPFKFKEWVRGSYIHLVRNENYFRRDRPFIDEIYYRIIPDAASRALALETGVVDLIQYSDVETFDVPRLKALPGMVFTTKGYEFNAPLAWLELNNRIKPLDDRRFRQAVCHAIDRNFIRDKLWFGLGRIPTGPINSVTKFYDSNVKKYDFSIQKATALLEEMGLKPGPDGVRTRLKLLQLPFGEVWTRTGEYVRQALGRVGIAVTLENTDVAGVNKRFADWDFDMAFNYVYQFGDPALGVSRSYVSSNIRKGVNLTNTCGYSNAEVDRLFEAAATANDIKVRQELYSKVQQILAEDVPVAWLLELEFPTMYNKKFTDLVTTAVGTCETFENARLT